MNVHLIAHDVGYAIDVLFVLFVIGLILFKSKLGVPKVTLTLTWVCVIIFVTSHSLGVSVSDGELSRKILMFNLVDFFLPLFSAHCVLSLIDKTSHYKKIIYTLYAIAISAVVFFIWNPLLYLQTSVPKMYFPNYYVAGPYYWVMLVFFSLLTIFFLIWMWLRYRVANGIEKNRIKYFYIALLLGFSIGSFDFFLIYNIAIDPLWGVLFVPFSVIPFTYAALQYDLLDISVVAKRALLYAIAVAGIGGFLSILNYANTAIVKSYAGFPDWVSSIVLAFIASMAVMFVWKKVRESDVLKYEFINVVTHKFRTPLTSIKWVAENLKESVPENLRGDIEHIRLANERLVELTNLLVNLSGLDDKSYEYAFTKVNVSNVISGCIQEVQKRVADKNISLSYVPQSEIDVMADEQKIKFVFQTLIDNAISYTPEHGKVVISATRSTSQFSNGKLLVTITDDGIGIPKDELKFIFTKFYRAQNGKKVDTEGMGIGLYLSRKIIERHKGKLTVQSSGEGRGTTFSVTLPVLN